MSFLVAFNMGGASGTAVLPAESPAGSPGGGVRIRVGIATDLEEIEIPCCSPEAEVLLGSGRQRLAATLKVTPIGVSNVVFRLQAAALKDEEQAALLARRLQAITGTPGSAFFDAGAGLYRVRVGRFSSRAEAETFKERYAGRGLRGSWVVSEGGLKGDAALSVSVGPENYRIPGRWLSVAVPDDGSVRVARGKFRGAVLVYLNDRGLLNLVNELPLEQYLRGVVPLEMGPEVYGQLASLRAQAIAARTYAARNLGQFESEGYDLCATPRCQVYGGAGAEHPVSDRAIAETAGQVLVSEGLLAEALYSSTCGGSTEDVQVVFPTIRRSYLKGVPCIEGPLTALPTGVAAGTSLSRGVMDLLQRDAPVAANAAAIEERLRDLASRVSLPTPADKLHSLRRREVARFVSSLFDLVLDVDLLAEDAEDAAAPRGRQWTGTESRLRELLSSAPEAVDEDLGQGQLEEMLFHVAAVLGIVRTQRAYFLERREDSLFVRSGGNVLSVSLGGPFGAYGLRSGLFRSGDLTLASSDRLRLVLAGERLIAVVQEHREADLSVPRRGVEWTRYRSDGELRSSVATRYPGFLLEDLEVVERGSSGRVARLRLHGAQGETFDVEGLPVRWTLGLPDTLFTFERRGPKGNGGWLFRGRGRGHGVGLCQIGAFAMAQRGHTHREILEHYYPGITLARLKG